VYDGEYNRDMGSLVKICEVEGSALPYGRQPFSLLGEAVRALELCAERYTTPRPSGNCLTVFVARKTGDAAEPLVRFDIVVCNDRAVARLTRADGSRIDTGTVAYDENDDVVSLVRKILEVSFSHKGGT